MRKIEQRISRLEEACCVNLLPPLFIGARIGKDGPGKPVNDGMDEISAAKDEETMFALYRRRFGCDPPLVFRICDLPKKPGDCKNWQSDVPTHGSARAGLR
jgi:hypothetical protein